MLFFDTFSTKVGVYNLILESFDELSLEKLTLRTDVIQITVISATSLCTFAEPLQPEVVWFGKARSWDLPLIESGSVPLKEITIVADSLID